MRSAKTALQPPTHKTTTVDPELAERFNRVLGETVEAMDDSGLRYAFIGGIASGGLGRPRSTHDIDLFVRPEDAELALRALAKKGFNTEKTDPTWLYKAFKENILVDIIFKSKGEIYFDHEMYRRMITAEFHGRQLQLVAPEDLLIIKAAAHSEATPSHWHDAIGLLSHANLDWNYLIWRARRAPRRILSLLLYAQSNDIWVPNQAIHELYSSIFDGATSTRMPPPASQISQASHDSRPPLPPVSTPVKEERISPARTVPHVVPSSGGGAAHKPHRAYALAHLRSQLAEDPRTNELDILIEQSNDKILLRGDVQAQERRQAIEEVAREVMPDCEIENQIRVLNMQEGAGTEDVK